MTIPADSVAAQYLAGVDAVTHTADRLTEAQWQLPACGEWSAAETVRHLVAVARWYHAWLDRALRGETSIPFCPAEMSRRNAAELAALTDLDGPTATTAFATTAHDYLERTRDVWEVPFAYPYGLVTVGLHCAIAAAEWHLHAWDISQLRSERHRPENPQELFIAVGESVAASVGGARGTAMRWAVPLASRRAPWETMLRRSGRTPSI